MKKFKSIVAMTAAIMALSAVAAPVNAFADDNTFGNSTNPDSKTTTLSKVNAAAYTVTIPAAVSFESDATTATADVTASGIMIGAGQTVKVSVASAKNYKMTTTDDTDTSASTDYIGYGIEVALKDGTNAEKANITKSGGFTAVTSSGVPDQFVAFANGVGATAGGGTVVLTFTATDTTKQHAGTYSDILTFTVAAN